MKKFFERLRCWLIGKLGGYTEQFTTVRNVITRLPDAKAKEVQIQTIEYRSMRGSQIDFEKRMKRLAIESIARFLDENGYIKWERRDDIEKCAIIFQATLWAVSAKELETSYQEWVETHGD